MRAVRGFGMENAMYAPNRLIMSAEDYLAWEARQERKHELVDGVVRLMSGASVAHNAIMLSLGALLWAALRGKPCRPAVSDLKVKTGEN